MAKKLTINEFSKKYFGITLTRHQMKWYKFIMNGGKRVILLAPRGHGKTTFVNLIFPAFLIANDPNIRILIVSHSKEMAESFSLSIRNVFEREDIQDDFGIEPGTPWRANSWQLKGSKDSKPTIRVVGARGKIAGWRGDMIFFDDLWDVDTCSSENTRKRVQHWIDYDVMPCLNPSAKQKVVVIGTRKHVHDWYGELLENPYYAKRIDKVWDVNKRPLWPAVFTREVVDQILEESGSLVFAQEYLNEPIPVGGLEFQADWLRYYELIHPDTRLEIYMGVDPSSGKTTDRSKSFYAIAVVGHDALRDKIYVLDLFKGKLSKQKQIEKATEFANRYAPDRIFVESVFEYTFVYDALRDKFRNVEPIDYVHTQIKGTNVIKKEERIRNIVGPAIEMGRLLFPIPATNKTVKDFIDYEYLPFPSAEMDLLDALTLSIHSLIQRKITDLPFFFPG
jgi:hypothetical protein